MTSTEAVRVLAEEFPGYAFFAKEEAAVFTTGNFKLQYEVSFTPGYGQRKDFPGHFCKAPSIESATRMALASLRLGLPEVVELPL